MKVSVVVPTTSLDRLRTLLMSLRDQALRPSEVIIVAKGVDVKLIEDYCSALSLRCIVLNQVEGYVTRALNMGKDAASGDIAVFTDDDAIALRGWLKRYVELFAKYDENTACISSRDIYVNMGSFKLLPTPDDESVTKLYRVFIRPVLEKPIPTLRKYWCGVYIDNGLNIRHGPCIPGRECYSLPLRGVNMAFSGGALSEFKFPEHPLLRRGIGFEQHVGLQLVLRGWDCVYVPNNPILHMARDDSLSRARNPSVGIDEGKVIKALIRELLVHNQ